MRRLRLADDEEDQMTGFGVQPASPRTSRGSAASSQLSLARLSVIPSHLQPSVLPLPEDLFVPATLRSLPRSSPSVKTTPPSASRSTIHEPPTPVATWPPIVVLVNGIEIARAIDGTPMLASDSISQFSYSEVGNIRLAIDRLSRKLRDMHQRPSEQSTVGSVISGQDESSSDDQYSESDGDSFTSEDSDTPRPRKNKRKEAKKAVASTAKKKSQTTKGKGGPLTIPQLKELLKSKGLPLGGRKSQLMSRWAEFERSNQVLASPQAATPRVSFEHVATPRTTTVICYDAPNSPTSLTESHASPSSAISPLATQPLDVAAVHHSHSVPTHRVDNNSSSPHTGTPVFSLMTQKIGFVSPGRLWSKAKKLFTS